MTAPLANQDKDAIALDPNFSTTRLVTREKPVIVNDPSSKIQSLLFSSPHPDRKGEGGLKTKGYFKRSYDKTVGCSDNLTLPLVTIITVVFNGEKSLSQTIQSVINQTYDNVEYIVIDGGSMDGTVDIIRKYEDKIDYWVSEKDRGVYDAMNKGVSYSKGDWILFLGADDSFANPRIIGQVFDSDKAEKDDNHLSKFDIIIGNVQYTNKKLLNSQFNSQFSQLLKIKNTVHHQAAFYRRVLFADFKYNPEFKVSADYELNLKLFLQRATYLKIDKLVTICGTAGISSLGSWSGYSEIIKIRKQYLSQPESIIYDFLTLLTFVIKKILIALFSIRK